MSRRIILPALVAGFLIAMCAVASAKWSGGVTGLGLSKAATVNAGNAPTAIVTSRTAQLTWTASTLSTGVPVTGYLIRRYNT
ncbi:MAG: hypothetical protein M3P18_00495, partial [Actinomycetota bacterium]|nr:hypothetical protein [Actinomycetota bacterium]